MGLKKTAVILLATASLAVVVALFMIEGREVVRLEFPNHAMLSQSDSARKGWAPNIIPSTAVDINIGYNIDTNSVWGEFSAPPEVIASIKAQRKANQQKPAGMDAKLGVPSDADSYFSWCDEREGLSGYASVQTPKGRVVYWGSLNENCKQ